MLVCRHHLGRSALANQNGRPDLSKRPAAVQSARIGRSTTPRASPTERNQAKTPSPVGRTDDADVPADESVTATPVPTSNAESSGGKDGSGVTEEMPRSASPPNPFDESDEEEDEGEKEDDAQTSDKPTANGDLPAAPVGHHEDAARPVPAPRRVSEPTPPPRPAPRVRLPRTTDGPAAGLCPLLHIHCYKDTCAV